MESKKKSWRKREKKTRDEDAERRDGKKKKVAPNRQTIVESVYIFSHDGIYNEMCAKKRCMASCASNINTLTLKHTNTHSPL